MLRGCAHTRTHTYTQIASQSGSKRPALFSKLSSRAGSKTVSQWISRNSREPQRSEIQSDGPTEASPARKQVRHVESVSKTVSQSSSDNSQSVNLKNI